MNPDLTRLIRLQQLETAADEARRKIADHPARTQALDARLQAARDAVGGIKARMAAAADKRRVEEKEVAGVQTRLAKYKDQLLEVKTNREYTAMLHEIEAAQNDIRTREDRILEIMMESDELNAAIKTSEAELKAAEKDVAAERAHLDTEMARMQSKSSGQPPNARRSWPTSTAMSSASLKRPPRDGRGSPSPKRRTGCARFVTCAFVHRYSTRFAKNESIIQCDSCRRILYFAGTTEASTPVSQV